MRETQEETGLTVKAVKMLGERVHPATGRLMSAMESDEERQRRWTSWSVRASPRSGPS